MASDEAASDNAASDDAASDNAASDDDVALLDLLSSGALIFRSTIPSGALLVLRSTLLSSEAA